MKMIKKTYMYTRPLVFPFEWFYSSNFGAFYSLLFGVSQLRLFVEGRILTYNVKKKRRCGMIANETTVHKRLK